MIETTVNVRLSPVTVGLSPRHPVTVSLGAVAGPPGSVDLTTSKGVALHDADPNFPRPVGYASVEWQGSVIPLNAIPGDTRIIT